MVGDIVFFNNDTWVGRVIKYLTGSTYSHVAIEVSDGKIVEATSFSKVVIADLNTNSEFKIKRVSGGLTSAQQIRLKSEIYKHIGKRYDYISILYWLLRLTINPRRIWSDDDSALYCSEFVDIVFTNIGIDLVPGKDPGFVTPHDLNKSPLLESIN